MTRPIRRAVTSSLAAIVLLLPPLASATTLDATQDRAAMMRLVADGWRDTQRADGFLPYGFDFLADRATDDPASAGFIIREAAALYVWAAYYAHSRDASYREPIRRGIAALVQRSLPIGKSRMQSWIEATRVLSLPAGRMTLTSALDRLGLLYRPAGEGKVVSADGHYETAIAGATAFALLAELAYRRASGDATFADQAAAWRTGLLMLRVPGGGFRQFPVSIDEDDYDNGEAWLALAANADAHRDDASLRTALAGVDRALIDRYAAHPSNRFFSWGAMAAAQRRKTTGDARFLVFLRTQAQVVVERFERQLPEFGNTCAAMEGVAATLTAFKQAGERDDALAARMRLLLSRELAKLPGLQIQPGQTHLALGGQAQLDAPHLARFAGAFLSGAYEPKTRIDDAAHCLSTLLMVDGQPLAPIAPRQ
jgi:hypothetical protein